MFELECDIQKKASTWKFKKKIAPKNNSHLILFLKLQKDNSFLNMKLYTQNSEENQENNTSDRETFR